ncbi:hypothetical protein DFJ74DRAFT_660602 [Hyaloraphidium curvatum]|nr:hypothetical protein DFJ74DRAFT_660602 [Hyaloraphidium curvatum]
MNMKETGLRHLPNPYVHLDDTPLPAEWEGRLRAQLDQEARTLLDNVQHGLLRGGGVDIYTGYAGVAFFFKRLAEFDPSVTYPIEVEGHGRKEETALQIAKRYSDTAMNLLQIATPGNDVAFLTAPSVGAVCVSAAIDVKMGKMRQAEDKAQKVLATTSRSVEQTETPSELLYGRAGLLYSYRFLGIKCKIAVPEESVRLAFYTTIQDGIRTARDSSFRTLAMRLGIESLPPLMWRFFGKTYLGAAHGVAGIITELMHYPLLLDTPMSRYLGTEAQEADLTVKDLLFETIQWLVGLLHPNLPSSLDSMKDSLVQWCHGAPGAAIMLCKALDVYGPENGIEEAAIKSADVVWDQGLLKKGVGLCHGIAGNAYAFLHLFKATGDSKYFARAVRFALFGLDWQERTERGEFRHPDHIWSLFEGSAGYANLAGRYFAGQGKPRGRRWVPLSG